MWHVDVHAKIPLSTPQKSTSLTPDMTRTTDLSYLSVRLVCPCPCPAPPLRRRWCCLPWSALVLSCNLPPACLHARTHARTAARCTVVVRLHSTSPILTVDRPYEPRLSRGCGWGVISALHRNPPSPRFESGETSAVCQPYHTTHTVR